MSVSLRDGSLHVAVIGPLNKNEALKLLLWKEMLSFHLEHHPMT